MIHMIYPSNKTKRLLVLTCALYMLHAAMSTLTTYSISKVMECAEIGSMEHLPFAIGFAVVVLILEKTASVAMSASNQWFVSIGELEVKSKIMKNILWRPLNIFRKKDDSYYINLLSTDSPMYRENCLGSYPWLCYFTALLMLSVTMLVLLNPILAVVTTVFSALPLLADKFLTKTIQKYKDAYSKTSEKYVNIRKETIEGYETIRLDGSRASFLERNNKAAKDTRYAAAKESFANSVSQEALYTSASVLRLIALGVGAVLVLKGYMRAAMLFAAMNYAIAISNCFSNFSYYIIAIHSTKKIAEKLKSECDVPYEETVPKQTETAPSIEYKSVSFSFGEHSLYQDFSYYFKQGGCYALVGESGSGKSTLIKLLLKYYDTYSGTICLNGQDIHNLNEQEIYEQVGVIDQSPWLFNASLYENITMCTGMPEETSEEYQKLLAALNLTELAKRVGNKPLGDFGDHISGGERQRISLARALRKRAKLMIFDEPTTGLDPENVKLINEFIFSQTGVTRIVISHDWSEEYWKRFDDVIKIAPLPKQTA